MDFRERLKLPLVSTADELAGYLTGVHPNPAYQPNAANGYSDCTLAAEAPCHSSKSGRAFVFGDDGAGGVTIRCMACAGGGLYQRVEEALGVRIQTRYSDGRLRWWADDNPPEGATPRRRTGIKRTAAPPEHPPLNANPLADGYTVGDMLDSPRWLIANGKKPATFRWRGARSGFRQSLPLEDGGIAQCRTGGADIEREDSRSGRRYTTRILGWGKRDDVERLRELLAARDERAAGWDTAIALSGDAESPADALAILDFDYKPADDPDGLGAKWRDAVKSRMAAAGCPIWDSTSGNGFHAVFGIPADELGGGYAWQSEPEPYPPSGRRHGVGIDMFAPGCKRLVALRLHKPHANTDMDAPLPIITRSKVFALIGDPSAIERESAPSKGIAPDAPEADDTRAQGARHGVNAITLLSRTDGATTYTVIDGDCDCQAAAYRVQCWHVRDARRLLSGEAVYCAAADCFELLRQSDGAEFCESHTDGLGGGMKMYDAGKCPDDACLFTELHVHETLSDGRRRASAAYARMA